MKRLTLEFVKSEFEKAGYILITDHYINAHQKLEYICKKHPNKIRTCIYNQIQRTGKACMECGIEASKEKQKLEFDKVKSCFDEKEYILLEKEYINTHTLMAYICPYHPDEIQYIQHANLQFGKGCPKCAIEKRAESQKMDFEIVETLFKNRNYTLIDKEYNGAHVLLRYICPNHPYHDNAITYANLRAGYGCPLCRESKGEKKVSEFLLLNEIEFISQYRFEDCKNVRTLPFDFYLIKQNMVIEYMGRQHYTPSDFGGKGEEYANKEFQELKVRDKIKKDYCIDNSIGYLDISYVNFDNIEEILIKELNIF